MKEQIITLEDIDTASRYLFGRTWSEILYRHSGGQLTSEQFQECADCIRAFLNSADNL